MGFSKRDKNTIGGGNKSPKKNTSTRVLNAPVLVGCLVWLIKFGSLIVYRFSIV